MDNETWKTTEGHPLLEVSDLGRVRIYAREVASSYGRTRTIPARILPPHIHAKGYVRIKYIDQGILNQVLVHRLVGRAFVPGEFPGATIDHIDMRKANNASSNLRWLSRSDNASLQRRHETALGLRRGVENPMGKLTDGEVREIRRLRASGESLNEIANRFRVCASHISHIATGKRRLLA